MKIVFLYSISIVKLLDKSEDTRAVNLNANNFMIKPFEGIFILTYLKSLRILSP